MANEFRHKDAISGRVREDEYEHIRQHILNDQATGDMVYASSATQLSGLPIGSTGQFLTVVAGLPAWSSSFAVSIGLNDDILFTLGTDDDIGMVNRSTILGANTGLAGIAVGTPVAQAVAANSLLIGNITASGDIAMYVNKGGNSQQVFWADGSSGDTAIMAASGQSVDHYIAGTKVLDHASGAFAFQENTIISSTGSLTLSGKPIFGGVTDWGAGATGTQITGAGYDWVTQTVGRVNTNLNGTAAAAHYAAMSITANQTSSNSIFGHWVELYVSNSVVLTGADNFAAIWGQFEAGTGVTLSDTGCFTAGVYANVKAGATLTVAAGHSLNGVRAQIEVAAITNNGTTAAFECLKNGGVDWEFGLYLADVTTDIRFHSGTTLTDSATELTLAGANFVATLGAITLAGAVTGGSQNISSLGTIGCGTITTTGRILAGTIDSPVAIGANVEGIEVFYSGDNADVTAIRARGILKTTDTTATAMGGLLQASNWDGIDAGCLNGALIEAIGKSTTTAATISTMRALIVNSEWGAFDTITDLRTLHVRTHTLNNATIGYFSTSGYLVYLENEAVGGNGQAMTAGIYFKGTNLSAGNDAFVLGIDFSGATITTADIKFHHGATLLDDGTSLTLAGANLVGTLGAVTLAGTVTINAQVFEAGAGYVEINTTGRTGLLMDGGIVTGGATPLDRYQNLFGGAFLSGGSSTFAVKQRFEGTLTGASGDTSGLRASQFGNSIDTQTAVEDIAFIAQVMIDEPAITDNLTGDITLATTLYINKAPTEGEYNTSLYIIQDGEDQDFITLADSDVAHGMTDEVPTDVFAVMKKYSATSGGLDIIGYKDPDGLAGRALHLLGRLGEAADTTKSTAGIGVVQIMAQIISSATVGAVAAGGNLLSIVNSGTTAAIFGGGGDLWLAGGLTAVGGNLMVAELANAIADVAGYGQFWVKNDTPNTPYFTDDTGVDRQIQTADYAGITVDGNAGATTIDLVDNFVLIDVFDTDMPERISNGAHGTDNIAIGATGVYRVRFDMSGSGGGTNKTFEVFAFELNASGEPITSTTAANPVVVTDVGHPFVNGNRIKITGVTTADELNDRIFTVTKLSADTYSLQDDEGVDIDGTGFGAGTGGTATLATILPAVHSHRKFTTADVGSLSGGGLVSLTKDKTLELYIKGITDATNPTIEYCSFYMDRVS